nr:hypothetical protein [Tanacetum cinerariifolium]
RGRRQDAGDHQDGVGRWLHAGGRNRAAGRDRAVRRPGHQLCAAAARAAFAQARA